MNESSIVEFQIAEVVSAVCVMTAIIVVLVCGVLVARRFLQ